MRRGYLILMGLAVTLALLSVMYPVEMAATGLLITTCILIFLAIYALSGVVGYFEKPSYIKIVPPASSRREVIAGITIFVFCIIMLILLWTIIAYNPLIYPYLKEHGII